ncbi:MAG: serine/threonine protein kinase [Wenzhouxiangella sp.]|nr:serine/threonine protein kinase [Wenzhouxiangella sp.]
MSGPDDLTSALTQANTLAEPGTQRPASGSGWQPGQRVGAYRLIRLLGAGGMGVVWQAEQLEPLRREVAIKLLPGHRDDPLAEAYFEVERQALAQLSHRAIAQIHDAGRLPDGSLFFAMEFVPGEPLDDFVRSQRMGPRDCARLLVEICRGVQHAHQRGLIHRDLKPPNILVQSVDGKPRPRIIDFGIAVAAGTSPLASVAGTSVRTMGTPAYMAPEQRTAGARIDARCDVYALGAILAEILAQGKTGQRPETLLSGTQRQLGLAHSLGQAMTVSDEVRGFTDVLHDTPRELRAIALKALSDDPDQRFDSAAALAEELLAWLDHRPVRSYSDSRLYRLRCFVRRYRVGTVAVTAVLLALVGGLLVAMHGLDQARQAQVLAEQRQQEGEQLIHYMLGEFADKLRPIARLDLLDGVGQQAMVYLADQGEAGNADQALQRARALRTLGEVQVTRQQFDLAGQSLADAYVVLSSWTRTASAELLFELGQIAFWRGAVNYRLGDLDQTELHWQQYLASAIRLNEQFPDDPRGLQELAYAYNNLGTLANAQQRLHEARRYFGRVVDIRRGFIEGPDDRRAEALANSLSWLARVEQQLGEPVAAWHASAEAVALVSTLRAHSDDGRLRQREANLRYVLGWNSQWLGDGEQARQELQASLELAREDVANDPTQPRRQLMMARAAFDRVALSDQLNEETLQAWATGQQGLEMLEAGMLLEQDMVELRLRACRAELRIAELRSDRATCLQALWPELEQRFHTHVDQDELTIAAELWQTAERIDSAPTDLTGATWIQALLFEGPASSLASLLIRRDFLAWREPENPLIADLDARIHAMRAHNHDERNPK